MSRRAARLSWPFLQRSCSAMIVTIERAFGHFKAQG
jgi:hypothetical protein